MATPKTKESSINIEETKPELEISKPDADAEVKPKPPTAADPKFLIHVINVGQGDSILIEFDVETGEKPEKKWYLVDGGLKTTDPSKKAAQHKKRTLSSSEKEATPPGEPIVIVSKGATPPREIDGTCEDREQATSDKKKKRAFNLEATLREKGLIENKGKDEKLGLNAIILTHPDGDHLGGINRLLKKFIIECPLITTEAAKLKPPENPQKKEAVEVKPPEKEKKEENPHKKEAVEVKPPEEEENQDLDLPDEIKLIFPTANKKVFYNIAKNSEIMKSDTFDFKKVPNNNTSILVAVGNAALLTGDSTADCIRKGLEENNLRLEQFKIFQVPHHGSRVNSHYEDNPEISEDDPLSRLKKHSAYKSALFYRGILAHTYFISHGNVEHHNHPHSEVTTGIALAAAATQCKPQERGQKKRKIVLTGLFHKDKMDYPTPANYKEFFKTQIDHDWKKYVEIHVPANVSETPYLTIYPDGTVENTTTKYEEEFNKHKDFHMETRSMTKEKRKNDSQMKK